jgi:hypothetical protein
MAGMMKWEDDYEGYGMKQPWPLLRYYPSIYLEGLRKAMKSLRQNRCLRAVSRNCFLVYFMTFCQLYGLQSFKLWDCDG